MDCHQILSGACNVGDRCFAVGSVEGIPFTVSFKLVTTVQYLGHCSLVSLYSFDNFVLCAAMSLNVDCLNKKVSRWRLFSSLTLKSVYINSLETSIFQAREIVWISMAVSEVIVSFTFGQSLDFTFD